MKINRESIIKIIKPALNVVIVVAVGTAMFQLGVIYQSSKKEIVKVENPYDHAFSPKEISIAVNESNELIMIERSTGKYIIYSDQIGKTIFGMYANRIHQEATNVGK
jgi:ribosomal protein S4E